ncbi:hypothetical protein PAALTS15_00040 [Paenibacillus alvei TS-15]|uniref:Uncharacterized protein n=1 Tax=Paenibacillus alvei TS-15 TaxID=1117108 RepID=S9UFI8_PAEAL|nr:hypothetical protein PAALTS15_00040 [Paenibacillus alvei TS-15]
MSLLDGLRNNILHERSEQWLFPNQDKKLHLTERTVQKVFEQVKERAAIQIYRVFEKFTKRQK